MIVPLWVRRLFRPMIPDAVMARVRLREHSRQVRTNVDVIVDGAAGQRRWLATTPDTYRIRTRDTLGHPQRAVLLDTTTPTGWDRRIAGLSGEDVIVVGRGDRLDLDALTRPLADPTLDAVVIGEVDPPRLAGRRRTEPEVRPVGVAVRPEVWIDVGGAPTVGTGELALLQRVRDAGHRIALYPVAAGDAPSRRSDPLGAARSAVVLALVPMHDVGGGSRGAQLALELLRRDFHVTYVPLFGTAESVDLGLRFVHPHLEQVRPHAFDPGVLAGRARGSQRLVLVEAPHGVHVDLASALAAHGYTVVYDLIDDWSAPSLGGRWYRPGDELRLVAMAELLVASAPSLQRSLEARGGRDVLLVPNAVNAGLFDGRVTERPPPDLPVTDGPTLGYHGSLYGDWFDWEALARVAARWSDGAVVLIGDPPRDVPELPPNVHLLGLKAQVDLPAYVGRFDVGLVPFTRTPVTDAVSPLKVYEYLASGVAVASTPLEPLYGLDGVHLDNDLLAATQAALSAPAPDPAWARAMHSWSSRVTQLLAGLGWDAAASTTFGARIEERPATHYGRSERRVGPPARR